jgi:hypothetical protein
LSADSAIPLEPNPDGKLNDVELSDGDLNDGDSLPEGVTQQLIRAEHGGIESLSGLLRVDFPAGDRTQVVHLAFCPPFHAVPEVNVASISGPPATVKVSQVESFGMRVDVRRNPSANEPDSIVLEIEATAQRSGIHENSIGPPMTEFS